MSGFGQDESQPRCHTLCCQKPGERPPTICEPGCAKPQWAGTESNTSLLSRDGWRISTRVDVQQQQKRRLGRERSNPTKVRPPPSKWYNANKQHKGRGLRFVLKVFVHLFVCYWVFWMFNTSIIPFHFKETSDSTLIWIKKSLRNYIRSFFVISLLIDLSDETWKSPVLQIHIHKTSQVWKKL